MIKVTQCGDVTIYAMGRTLGPWVPYVTHAFQVGPVLIDTGTRYAGEEFLTSLSGPVRAVINTHHHEDHTGNNRAVQDRWGASVYAHQKALGFIESPASIRLRPYQKAVWGRPQGSTALPVGGSFQCDDFELEVMPCRGHCDDHLCLYDRVNKRLFSGDMFCGVKNVFLRADEDFSLQLDSIRALAALEVNELYCGLKGLVRDGTGALQSKLEFMQKLRDDVLDLRAGGMGPHDITVKLLGRENFMFAVTAGHFSKLNLVKSVLAGS